MRIRLRSAHEALLARPLDHTIGYAHDSMAVPDLAEVRRTLRKVQRFRQRLRGEVDVDALVELGLQIGSNVYIAPWVLIDPVAAYLISIGDGCRLAPRAHILAHDATSREALGFHQAGPGAHRLPGVRGCRHARAPRGNNRRRLRHRSGQPGELGYPGRLARGRAAGQGGR